ncbi:LLM class flavin-dependent oxidoreductase [Amycolatopsis sp. CA-161197]|uniref:LLM class flavin-dependent oxidoreductase n=1 Tax=Amycolatopsis sp. CA-161197 TaxID=3239922 RepID=UPI003D8F1AFF
MSSSVEENVVKPNPIRDSANKLKLSIFGMNGGGASFTFHPDRFSGDWEATARLAKRADALGIEGFVSASRWHPFGGDGHYSGDVMETLSWAGAVASITERISVISTVPITLVNPAFVAKAEATLDLISRGRAGMNLVCGWFQPEFDLFGVAMKEHGDRYAYGDDWMEVFDKLWSSTESFDLKNDSFELKNAISQPHPLQSRPVLLNAGGSPRGRHFAAQHAEVAFTIPDDPDPRAVQARVAEYREEARKKFGKEIQIWLSAYVVQKDTKAEAEAYAHDYIVTQGDDKAVEEFIAANIPNAKTMPPERMADMANEFKAGYGAYPLVGTATDIATRMTELSAAGVDGLMLLWLDYETGLERLAADVLPRLEEAGLRSPAPSA